MIRDFFFVFLLIQSALAKSSGDQPVQQKWQTLSGDAPSVIARGGFSGLFPEASQFAYQLALSTSLSNVILFCDLQLTKDESGICKSDLRLDNSTNIALIYPKGQKTYKEHKLDVGAFIQESMRSMAINYISSPEIGFLKSLNGKINEARTKLIFRFLAPDAIEPTTKKTYSTILKDLSSIKSFASGILVPKAYIWPVDADQYLQAPTSLVSDAHKQKLEVYANGFANDVPGSYNYSYDPTAEYLQYIEGSSFSVDGFLTDFPPTASEAIACLAQNKNLKPKKGKALIISRNGASGTYAACSDLAYNEAIEGGVDIIDCSVQMSKDGVPFCLESADLTGSTTAMATFMSKASTIPEMQPKNGIFSFDLTWAEIQTLQLQLVSPIEDTGLPRNPANKNKGKLVLLSEFLEIAKTKAVSGVLINIKNAAYLASKKGFSITDVVTSALSNATFDKQSTQQVLIESDDTSVLSEFNNVPTYKKVLTISEIIGDAPIKSVEEIKKFADAVNIPRGSIVLTTGSLTTAYTDVVDRMHKGNLTVYVSVLRNEYTTIAFDFFSDPIMEIASYVSDIGVDGVITEYPATASAYMRSPCSDLNADLPYTILPAEPGSLINLVPQEALPPADAPAPALEAADIVDPPLPAATIAASTPAAVPVGVPTKSGAPKSVANEGICLIALVVLSFLSLGYYH
ncbi:hypothetical protein GIB67_034361 [Kingdonia uniflora]|uniref:glycerophosphodiester phosphodiesterase n=1 Tax=Kingdonia uniflora TaxID=39325 RepID=A0A7J7NS30_9MAGN|nr:hypothetical protein GIB67_034361 [Kingdonia uniflora]